MKRKMKKDQIDILNQFSRMLEKEIDIAIKEKAHYLSALGLSSYTEYIGGLFRMKLKRGESKNNYNKGLKLMGEKYADLVDEFTGDDSMYIRIRCGLVHEYFIKESSIIWLEKQPATGCGIEIKDKNVINLYSRKYFNDLKDAIDKLKRQCEQSNERSKYISETIRELSPVDASGIIAEILINKMFY